MYCIKCGAQLPDDAKFCYKCGAVQNVPGNQGGQQQTQQPAKAVSPSRNVIAASTVTELKCPGCGAPIKPQFGEMVITCQYCGTSVSLASSGWENIQRHTMFPIIYIRGRGFNLNNKIAAHPIYSSPKKFVFGMKYALLLSYNLLSCFFLERLDNIGF